jgi:membrane-associated phospholipid phosphatase
LTRTIAALILGALLVAVCYFFVDWGVARFVHDHSVVTQDLGGWPEFLSDCLKDVAMAAILVVVLWRLWRRAGRLQTVLLAISVDLVVIYILKSLAKWTFGRTWPETWNLDWPSWIGAGVYGFHPFHSGPGYKSFPSGHAAVVFSVAAILWFSYPRGRWCYGLVCAAMCAALIGLNYHFVGDVIGGAVLGWITGAWIGHAFRGIKRG